MDNLRNFFEPKIIAIIGASDHKEKVGGILMRKALKSGCKIVPVNPQHDYVMGKKCYKSILDVQWKIDLAVIAIPAPFVAQALGECGLKKIKSVIIISAGFAEAGNAAGEKELITIADKYNMQILGPNCFGVFNPKNNLDLTFSASTPKQGNVAFISQSGALWSYASDFATGMEKKGFGFSGFVSLGNMAEMGFGRFIRYFCRKKDTKAIVLYIEKFNKGRRFMETCKKCSKKIYAVKAGKSAKGAEAAISHTASLATDYEIYKGAFKQAGVILCDSLLEAFEKASGKKLMPKAKNKRMKIGKRIFIVTNAGGAGALISDYLSEKGLDIVSSDGLKSPMDILGTALAQDYKNALEKLKNKDFYDSLIVILTPQSMSEIAMTAQVIADFGAETKKKIIALFLGGNSMKSANFIFQKNNIPCFNTLEEARESLSR